MNIGKVFGDFSSRANNFLNRVGLDANTFFSSNPAVSASELSRPNGWQAAIDNMVSRLSNSQQNVQAEATKLIATHTSLFNLDEDALGKDLAARMDKSPELVRAVFSQLSAGNKVEVGRAMIGATTDDSLRNAVFTEDGRKLLLDVNRWLANNALTGDGRANAATDMRLRERIGIALTRTDDITMITAASNKEAAPVLITAEQLLKIKPSLGDRATQVASDINQAIRDGQITTRVGQAMFVSQVLHEIGTRSDLNEGGGKIKYQGKTYDYFFYMYDKDSPNPAKSQHAVQVLGNIEVGDGERFHGRGYIQLTGRNNYRAAGKYLGIDLENNPQLATDTATAARVAGWFWRYGNGDCNRFTSKDTEANFKEVTLRINGGLNGYEDRKELYKLAKEALGINSK